MKLKIKLKDPKQCWECPCLKGTTWFGNQKREIECGYKKSYKIKEVDNYENHELIRPQKCIKENGK